MDEAGFRDFIAPRLDPLRRTAYLLCGDWHTADDAVATAVLKVYQSWHRISRLENVDAYLRRAVVNAWLDERRRPWRRERSVPEVPPGRPAAEQQPDQAVHDRLAILKHLDALPARRRAVVVLRYYCDLSVEETAQVLECSTGTVKSQAARALETLRAAMVDVPDLV
jgi:RNA polymerase sigma-70 factor (sigma-E family)